MCPNLDQISADVLRLRFGSLNVVAVVSEPWTNIHRAWSLLEPPLRPNAEIVARMRDCLANHRQSVLVLGVTPEFADLADDVLAVDASTSMIGGVWPGDTDRRRAVEGNWLNLPSAAASRRSAVCDGGLTVLPFPDGYETVFGQVVRVLEPGGRAVIRLYSIPDPPETLEELKASTWNGEVDSFHAFKFRLAMARAAEGDAVHAVLNDVWNDFADLFPDRAKLAEATGWSAAAIDTIDFYRDSDTVYSYPTRDRVAELARAYFADVSLVDVGTYPMADRCPLLILDKAA